MRRELNIILAVLVLAAAGCSKPLVTAKVDPNVGYVSKSFPAGTAETIAAVKWALKINGYSLSNESSQDMTITTTWAPTTSDSHAIDFFQRRDYGVNGAYHQLEVQVSPEEGRTKVYVGSRLKTIVARLRSTGIEEKKILNEVGNFLRTSEPTVTNLGLEE